MTDDQDAPVPVWTDAQGRAWYLTRSEDAGLTGRIRMLRLVWGASGEIDVPAPARRAARWLALRQYVFSRHAQVSYYHTPDDPTEL